MSTPRIYIEYEVWRPRSNNMVAYFDTAAAALKELGFWVDHDGESVLSDLYLSLCKYSPDLDDDEQLELEDDEWIGPGGPILAFLELMVTAETPARVRQ